MINVSRSAFIASHLAFINPVKNRERIPNPGCTGRRVTLIFYYHIKRYFDKLKNGVAEWSALHTGKRGDPSSIPAEVKAFFGKESIKLNSRLLKLA